MKTLFKSDGVPSHVFIGLPGAGKTVIQTEELVLPDLIEGREVWCCYWLNWNLPNFHYFEPGDFDAVKNLRNCTIVFDELAQNFEPRQWQEENGEMRRFFQLHRHRHNRLIGNTQDISLVAKSIGIIINHWYYLEAAPSPIIDWLFNLKRVRLSINEMTYQEMKKMANGFDLEGILKLETVGMLSKIKSYSHEKLLHKELNEFKTELQHQYCPKCKMRTGNNIPKEKNLTEKTGDKCPACKTELEIRETGMFDTDYEPPTKKKKGTWKFFVPSPEGYKMIEDKNPPPIDKT